MSLADRIAQAALAHYETTLPKTAGKPKPETEWTVYAAILLQQDKHFRVISCATGTKCGVLPAHQNNQPAGLCVLVDCHAEVLAKRGLLRLLWKELLRVWQSSSSSSESTTTTDEKRLLLEPMQFSSESSSSSTKYQLRSDLQLHLYISDAPCGDASIYQLHDDDDDDKNARLQFTGAKVIVPDDASSSTAAACRVVAREGHHQAVGRLRTKSGRSNLQSENRSCSMSCSDKLVRWSILGLQGGWLSTQLRPVHLSSIVVGQDPRLTNPSYQLTALERAIPDRVREIRALLETSTVINANLVKDIVCPQVLSPSTLFKMEKRAWRHAE